MIATGWNSSVASVLRQRPLQRLIPLVNVLLVLAIAYALAQLTWLGWPSASLPELAPPAKNNPVAAVSSSVTVPAAELAALHLFGEIPPAPVAMVEAPPVAEAPAPVVVAPLIPLNLVLKGVVSAEDANNARAIIADATGKEDSFKVDDKLPQDAILKKIFADHVVLSRNEQEEILRLPSDPEPGGAGGVAGFDPGLAAMGGAIPPPTDFPQSADFGQGAQDALTQQNIDAAQILAAEASGLDPATGADSVAATLRNYRDVLATNPQSLAGVAQAEPVQEGDKFLGYRVQPGSDPNLFSSLGLQPGDIIKSVNGIVLDSPTKAFELLQNMASADAVQGVIERNGQQITLSHQVGDQ